MERLNRLKTLLNLSGNEYDEQLEALLALLTEQAMIYTGRIGKKVPDGLDAVIVQMAAEYVRANRLAGSEGAVASVHRGDTTITYGTGVQSASAAGDFIQAYRHLLRPFMLVKMR